MNKQQPQSKQISQKLFNKKLRAILRKNWYTMNNRRSKIPRQVKP